MRDPTHPVNQIGELPRAGSHVTDRDSAVPLLFPRPSPLFLGRQDELARGRRLLDSSPLLLAYGVPGIGKTEFVYRLVADLRATPRWRHAQLVLVRAHAGQPIELLLAQLDLLLHGQRRLPGGSLPVLTEPALRALAKRLDRTAHLVFLDDVHHLDPAALAEVASYLARRIDKSRLLLASRSELLLAPETPPPAVVRLPALTASEAAELAARLAEYQGTVPPEGRMVYARTGGSPRRIHRLLQAGTGDIVDAPDDLTQTLRALRPAARRSLVLARLLAGQLPETGWVTAGGSLLAEQAELRTLAHSHLVEVGAWTVPEVVWLAFATEGTEEELGSAHRLAARLLLRSCRDGLPGAPAAALAAVEHQILAGEPAAAWDTFERWTPSFRTRELASRALTALTSLRAQLPAQGTAMDLLAARLFLDQGELAQAQAILAQIEGAGSQPPTACWWLLSGQIAQRAGQLSRAEEGFSAALAAAATAPERAQAALHLAELAVLRGHAAEAQRRLDAVGLANEGEPPPTLHASCTYVQILLLLGRPAAAARIADLTREAHVAGRARPARPGRAPRSLPLADRELVLAALATLAHCGCGELAAARRSLLSLGPAATSSGEPPSPLGSLGTGVVLLTAGEVGAAQRPLKQAHDAFVARHDLLPAAAAAIALGTCALARGEFEEAADQLSAARQLATRAGGAPLQELASALRASALLAAGHPEAALALAAAVAASSEVPPRARALSRYVLWRVYALAGDAPRAAQELAIAAAEVVAAEQEILWPFHALEQAEFAAAHAQPQAALEPADRALRFFSERGMQHEVARAQLALALAYASRRAPADLALADEALGLASELAARHGYAPLLLTAALIEAALAHHRGDSRAARAHLHRGLVESGAAAQGLAAQPLRAALTLPDAAGSPASATLLARLGLLPSSASASLLELRSPGRRQLLTPDAASSERARFDLTIDLDRNEIVVQASGRRVGGRPLMCAILAQLVATCAEGADAEHLFREVWKGAEYHALRHRNTIHVALTRLRQLLRELVPERELVETTATGWRLTADSNLCTLRSVRG